ncbi:MAG: response regulator [Bacteroidetes bacterium]|nr:MAG: response regulator [Bacteroidota bacterium]
MNNPSKLNEAIFIVEDDGFYALLIQNLLVSHGYHNCHVFDSGKACLEHLDMKPKLIFLDYFLGLENGHSVLGQIKDLSPETYVVMLSGQEYVHISIKSFRLGAFDYIEKNKDASEHILAVAARIFSNAEEDFSQLRH